MMGRQSNDQGPLFYEFRLVSGISACETDLVA
jgi:hypothetical protein